MKRLSVIFILFLAAMPQLNAAQSSASERFHAGVESYRQAQYPEAIAAFQGLLDDGYVSFELYVNLGNAAYKNGDLGLSVLSYERALLHEPGNEDVAHNLNVVRARLRDRVEPIPLLFFVQWWNDLKTGHRPETLFIWSLGFFWLLAAAVFVFFGMRQVVIRRISIIAGILFFSVFVAALALTLQRSGEIEARRSAVVMASEAAVRSSADAAGVESFIVHEGLKVEILDERDSLVRIRLADGKNGWIAVDALARI